MRIFISYRRDDCHREATMVYFGLDRNPEHQVFLDVEAIGYGQNFVEAVSKELDLTDVVLVLIGDDWLSLKSPDGFPRIEDPTDYVFTEVRLALERKNSRRLTVLPVLVEGAEMPSPQELPEAISGLALLNAFQVKDDSLTTDIGRLDQVISSIRPHDDPSKPSEVSQPTRLEVRVLDESDEVAAHFGEAMARLAERAEQLAREGKAIVERDLSAALASELPDSVQEAKWPVPNWDPQPGRFDILVRGNDPRPRIAIETKLKKSNDLYESIWDAIKLASLDTLDHLEGVYLVGGTTRQNWDKPIAGVSLFSDGLVDLVDEIHEVGDWWSKYILGDSAGRPLFSPRAISVSVLGTASLELRGAEWEIRLAKLLAEDGPWVEFQDGEPPSGIADDTAGDRESAGTFDTVVVAGKRAYPEYLRCNAYICQAGRSFREVSKIAFYRDRAIQPEVASILHHRDNVSFSPENAERLRASGDQTDSAIALIIEASIAKQAVNDRKESESYQVMLLTGPHAPETIRIGPVLHTGRHAWTQNQRYASSRELAAAATTNDLSRAVRDSADQKDRPSLNFDKGRSFIESIPKGRWTSYREVAAAAGAPRGGMAVGEWLRRQGEEIDGVWRVLRSDGSISDGWAPNDPNLPSNSEELRVALEREGIIFGGNAKAHVGQIWRAADWPGP